MFSIRRESGAVRPSECRGHSLGRSRILRTVPKRSGGMHGSLPASLAQSGWDASFRIKTAYSDISRLYFSATIIARRSPFRGRFQAVDSTYPLTASSPERSRRAFVAATEQQHNGCAVTSKQGSSLATYHASRNRCPNAAKRNEAFLTGHQSPERHTSDFKPPNSQF